MPKRKRAGPMTYAESQALKKKRKRRTMVLTPVNTFKGGFIGKELKYVDYNRTLTVIDDTVASSDPSTAKALNSIAQGSGQSQRIGNKVMIKSIQIKGFVQASSITTGAAINSKIVRMVVFIDKQTNGAQATKGELFELAGISTQFLRNLKWSSRFKVLLDKYMQLDYKSVIPKSVSTAQIVGDTQHFDYYKKLDLPVQFKDTNAVVDDIIDNSIHILFLTNAGTTGDTCQLRYNSRIRFTG